MSEFKVKFESLYNNKYFKNISWLFFEKGIRILLGLSLGLWVARYLGPSAFGELSYAQSIVGLAASLAALGLEGIVIREIVRTPEERGLILGSAFFLKFSATILAEIILIALTLMNGVEDNSEVLTLIMSVGMIFQAFNIFDFYFKSEIKSKFIVYSNTISLIIVSGLRLYFILTKKDVLSFAWAIALDNIFVAGLLFCFYKKLKLRFKWSLSKKMMLELLKDSWPLALSSIVLTIQSRIDQVMLKSIKGAEDVGLYSASLRLVEVFDFIPMALKSTFLPYLIRKENESEVVHQSKMMNYFRVSFFLFLIISIPLSLSAKWIIPIVFGDAYLASGVLMMVMSFRLFFTNMSTARSVFILNDNLLQYSFVTMLISTAVNIFCNYSFIPLFGAMGATYATMISFTVNIFVIDLFISKLRPNVFMQFKAIFTFYKLKLSKEATV